MIYRSLLVSSIAFAAATTSASAQNFSGNLGFGYAHPTDSADASATEYFGGLEYAINRNFAIGLDLSSYSIEDVDDAIVSSTWHFIYHLNESSSVSVFAGADVVASDTQVGVVSEGLSFAGLEGGAEFGAFEAEGYIGVSTTEGDAGGFTMLGASGTYDIANGFSAIGKADFINGEGYDLSNLSVGVEYEIFGGPELYGKIGRRAADDDTVDTAENFIEIGASVSFGGKRGATFSGRSLFEQF